MLERVKMALRITTDAYDDELNALIESARLDLSIAGVDAKDDAICGTAICTYCKMLFGEPDNYDKLKGSYDEQKAQLSTATAWRA